jgi:hypothetical protein
MLPGGVIRYGDCSNLRRREIVWYYRLKSSVSRMTWLHVLILHIETFQPNVFNITNLHRDAQLKEQNEQKAPQKLNVFSSTLDTPY